MALSLDDVKRAGTAATKALSSYGLKSCVFGSLACALYGVQRVPHDVDMLVLSNSYEPERIKRLLCQANSSFHLVDSENPKATYKLLYIEVPAASPRKECKVDILTPGGDLLLPSIPLDRLYEFRPSGISVPSPIILLMLKLKGWADHCASPREDFREKGVKDVGDIKELLKIAIGKYTDKLQTESWLGYQSVAFKTDSLRRVVEFSAKYPDTSKEWRQLQML